MRRWVALAGLIAISAAWLLAHAARPVASAPSSAPMLALRPAHLGSSDGSPSRRAALDLQREQRPTTSEAHTARAELEHAHPLSERLERLREQQALIGQLNDALDLGDAEALRTLLERYDAVQPEDPMRLAEGYERVADCIEAGAGTRAGSRDGYQARTDRAQDEIATASVRANARRYYDDARASSVRRYVRRFCLE